MTSSLKKVLVTGSSGYVGNYLLKNIALKNPTVQCVGMSRRGTPRKGEPKTATLKNVSYLEGDCLKPASFENELADVDAVVHTVGALFEINGMTYDAHNRDSCINMAYTLERFARESNERRNFVMISSAKAPFFAPRYLSSKVEAENYLLEKCKNLQPTIIKPGVVLNTEHRWWGGPVGMGNDLAWWLDKTLVKSLAPQAVVDATDFLIPARSTQLTTIEHFVLAGIHGENPDPCIVGPDEYIAYETKR